MRDDGALTGRLPGYRVVIVGELTCPGEEGVTEANLRKEARYLDLTEEIRGLRHPWTVHNLTLEVGTWLCGPINLYLLTEDWLHAQDGKKHLPPSVGGGGSLLVRHLPPAQREGLELFSHPPRPQILQGTLLEIDPGLPDEAANKAPSRRKSPKDYPKV